MITIPEVPSRFLKELRVGQLRGRVLELPSPRQHATPILLIYGHHSSLERMYSIAQAFSDFGPVVVPDLPGFGGMMNLANVDKAPTIDNLADYMADFVRQRFSDGQLFILEGMSLGFLVATRMLQRHPDLVPQVHRMVSLVGFVHHDDFGFSAQKQRRFARIASLMARKVPVSVMRNVILRKPVIAATYHLRARTHPKMKGYSWRERQNLIDFEFSLWRDNEARTYFSILHEMLTIDLTKHKIALPVEHIAVGNDQYFDNAKVEKHLAQVFTHVRVHQAHLPNHVPTVLEGVDDARQLLPKSFVDVLAQKS